MEDLHSDPAQLCFESVRTRRLIIASYWAVVLLAIPLWWKTTSIERLSLPVSRVYAQRNRELQFLAEVNIEARDGSASLTLAQEVQKALQRAGPVVEGKTLDLHLRAGNKSEAAYNVVLDNALEEPVVEGRELYVYGGNGTSHGEAVRRIKDALSKLLAPYDASPVSQASAQRVMKYSPRYRLAFTLLNEDAASANAAMAWDVQGAIQNHIGPLLEKLSDLHNFTIESQVQFHAPLAFEPRHLQHEGRDAFGLTHEDLTVFINSAEWTLSSSVSNDPVVHFVLFVPSSRNTPLHILDQEGSVHPSNAFLLPQWGGIVLFNPPREPSSTFRPVPRLSASDLSPIFNTFARQLLTLLGVPGLPPHVHPARRPESTRQREPFTDWELDALLRRRALENVQSSTETLEAIVRLVDQIENMPVGQDVVGDVQDALDALNEAHDSSRVSPVAALKHSARALTLASRAFFNPGMLALLYFPAEHTYAVYTPLFASVAAPLIGAVMRELVAWRRVRKAEQAERRRRSVGEAGTKAE
ncbi:phosphatidylinositol-glycan biosynthesis class S protein-domain-containing protein [Trametes punicea]|nr:phosphatidylinositol-glycan biosynthesis class S protein-domain-containing protein [Trametes punicea]